MSIRSKQTSIRTFEHGGRAYTQPRCSSALSPAPWLLSARRNHAASTLIDCGSMIPVSAAAVVSP